MCTVCMLTRTFEPARHPDGDPVFSTITEGVDAAESTSTVYTISVGDTFDGALGSLSDEDWVRVSLVEGETYSITMDGVSLHDPLVSIYNTSGTSLLGQNDDANGLLDSEMVFTASYTGTYYIQADSYDYAGDNTTFETGTYTLSVAEANTSNPGDPADAASLDDLALYLSEGYWGGREHTYDTSVSNSITVNLDGLTADAQVLARMAMESWEMVADITFDEVSSGEMITFDDEDYGAFAYAPNAGSTSTFRGDRTNGVELNIEEDWLDFSGTTIDSYSFTTFVHEIGHAIGLGHQGDYNGNASYRNDSTFSNDSWQVSVMSYFDQTENTSIDASFAYPIGAMMADILAIQNLYGAPDADSATAGDTTYGEGSNLGNYLDEVFDWFATGNTSDNLDGNTVAITVYDRDGEDTFELGFLTDGAGLDLREEQYSDLAGFTGILGISRGTVIENAVLGSGHDTVTGNAADNVITAGDGNDRLVGNEGRDILLGENGNDHLSGGANNDRVVGGQGDDTIFGGAQNDTLRGGGGEDNITGGNGQDLVFLGAGNDVFFDNTQSGVFGADTVFAFDGDDTVNGGSGDDTFLGEAGRDVLLGRAGDDSLSGGTQNDTIEGGSGNDTANGGNGADQAILGNGDDLWIDNTQVRFGDDSVLGGNGDDTLQAGGGNDTLGGGGGADTFVLAASINDDVITDYDVGTDALDITASLWDGALTQGRLDALTSVQNGNLVFDFDNGDSLTLNGVTSTTGLLGDIDLI